MIKLNVSYFKDVMECNSCCEFELNCRRMWKLIFEIILFKIWTIFAEYIIYPLCSLSMLKKELLEIDK